MDPKNLQNYFDSYVSKIENFIGHFLHGLKLKSYKFNKYKTKKETRSISISVVGDKNKPTTQLWFLPYGQQRPIKNVVNALLNILNSIYMKTN